MIHWSVNMLYTLALVLHHKERERYGLALPEGKKISVNLMDINLYQAIFLTATQMNS